MLSTIFFLLKKNIIELYDLHTIYGDLVWSKIGLYKIHEFDRSHLLNFILYTKRSLTTYIINTFFHA